MIASLRQPFWIVWVTIVVAATTRLLPSVQAFGTVAPALATWRSIIDSNPHHHHHHHRHRIFNGQTVLFRIRCENKYYQLEEMEDRENCTTELFLKEDGTVLVGDTDGPLWTDAKGEWMIAPGTNDFVMTITRTFGAGQENSPMGEFEYQLERTFQGDMTEVGESVAITGVLLSEDPMTGEDKEVGFFNMIDGTDVRLDKRADAQSGTRDESDLEAIQKRQRPVEVSGHDGMSSEMAAYQRQSQQAPALSYGAPSSEPYGYASGSPPPAQSQPALSYEEQLRMQQQGYDAEPPIHNDPYSSYYNQNQFGQSQQPPPTGYGMAPPPPQQQTRDPYGNGGGPPGKPVLDPYGDRNFERQRPGPSEAFGRYGHRTYGGYAEDDPGYGGPPPKQQQHQPPQPSDPYDYSQMQNGGGYGNDPYGTGNYAVEKDPNPPFPPQQQQPEHLDPYGQDNYSQDAWPGYQ